MFVGSILCASRSQVMLSALRIKNRARQFSPKPACVWMLNIIWFDWSVSTRTVMEIRTLHRIQQCCCVVNKPWLAVAFVKSVFKRILEYCAYPIIPSLVQMFIYSGSTNTFPYWAIVLFVLTYIIVLETLRTVNILLVAVWHRVL